MTPTECAGMYCKKVLPRPEQSATVGTFPAAPEDCTGDACRRYRLQWKYSSQVSPQRDLRLISV